MTRKPFPFEMFLRLLPLAEHTRSTQSVYSVLWISFTSYPSLLDPFLLDFLVYDGEHINKMQFFLIKTLAITLPLAGVASANANLWLCNAAPKYFGDVSLTDRRERANFTRFC